ncbi:MAG: L,D-transpeptidase family protein [Desulfobacterales bacterium]
MSNKPGYKISLILLFFLFAGSVLIRGKEVHGAVQISDFIKIYINQAKTSESMWIGCEEIHSGQNLFEFYENRSFKPVWVTSNGVSTCGLELMNILSDAGLHGLSKKDYHFACIEEWVATLEKRSDKNIAHDVLDLAGFDIVMTDAFLVFGSHLANGKVDPEKIYPQWISSKIKTDVFSGLNKISEHVSVHDVLRELAPPYSEYWELLSRAKWYQQVENSGGWPLVAEGKLLRYSDLDSRVPDLRRRLEIGGYIAHGMDFQDTLYDRKLEKAVRKFQENHGLEADGIIGKNTITQLNISAGKRREQILINLERWRWLPRHLGQRYIRVNTASFSLQAVDKDEIQLDMRVIVGKDYQITPVFSKQLRYIEFNPYWNVPRDIVRTEILPQVTKNPEYLDLNNYEIVNGLKDNSPLVDHSEIDWQMIGTGNFPGRVRQTPGPWNALGQIKFMFPNKFDVYLHDTPEKKLFQKTYRALSHGCIRLEKPIDLAVFVLQDDLGWNRKQIEKILRNKQRKAVGISSTCMIHLLYFTCWIDQQGTIQFRDDIYKRDELLWEALHRTPDVRGFGR